MAAVLTLDHLHKRIGKRTIIHDLSLEVNEGEVFGFLGPNGAGKTTTIRMVAGLSDITSGEVRIGGVPLTHHFEQCLRNMGCIIEEPLMYRYMSGWDNLRYYARMYPGLGRNAIEEALERVGMQARAKDKVKTYSLGMRQRLGLAQAIMHKPKLLILDEPTNGLDPAGIHDLRDFLKMIAHDEGMTVFVSSHILSEMQLLCDRVGILVQGELKNVVDVDKIGDLGGPNRIHVRTDRPAEAAALVTGQLGLEAVPGEDGTFLDIVAEKERTSDVVTLLAGNGFQITGIEEQVTQSLEDFFMQLTGGQGIE